MTREEITKNIVRGITDKIEATTDIDDWAEFWGFTRDDYEEFLDKALEQEVVAKNATSEQFGNSEELGTSKKNLAVADQKEIYSKGFEDGQRAYACHMELCKEEQEPCEDCISRKDALSDEGLSEFHYYEDYAKMRNYLKALPSVQPKAEQEPCEDCASALNRVMEYTYGMLTTEKAGLQHLIKSMLDDLPSINPQEPKQGHWIGQRKIGFGEWEDCYISLEDGFLTDDCHCSECGEEMEKGERGIYCPNCGCQMDSEVVEDG